ncbi:hypothetical protein HNY73_022309 [Argiope bruennichi]|uniref:Secreted protein n=1 Tax=Argiope bruennichi TaxID=94029 RepID=A0A8T0E433_ARGBR|nr:hypothetical protein HNY73_022309 [Argiope bruennichi]
MFTLRFCQVSIMLATFLVTSAGAASICSENSSNTACNTDSLDYSPDYEYVLFRSDNQTSSPHNESGNKTDEFDGYPFFGQAEFTFNFPFFHVHLDLMLDFNGTVGNKDGDKIHAELSSQKISDTAKFSLELLALDRSGSLIRFTPSKYMDLDSQTTTTVPDTIREILKNSSHPDISMFCIKLP